MWMWISANFRRAVTQHNMHLWPLVPFPIIIFPFYQRGGCSARVPEGAVWGQTHRSSGFLLGRCCNTLSGPAVSRGQSWSVSLWYAPATRNGSKTAHTVWILYSSLIMGLFDAGIIREREDRYELKSPTLFIFGEKDEVIPLDQVSEHCPSRKNHMYTETFCRNP